MSSWLAALKDIAFPINNKIAFLLFIGVMLCFIKVIAIHRFKIGTILNRNCYNTARYGANATTWDLLKSVAVFFMVIDHIGYFFVEGNMWWRAFGVETPIWFFLAGYAPSMRSQRSLVMFGALMVAADIAMSQPIFPLNNLFSIVIARYAIDCFEKKRFSYYELPALLCIWLPVSYFLIEYHFVGVIYALGGYFYRIKRPAPALVCMIAAHALLIGIWYFSHTYSGAQIVLALATSLPLLYWLHHFKLEPLTVLRERMPLLTSGIRILGRNTLAFYAWHVIAMEAIQFLMQPYTPWHLVWIKFS